MYLKSKGRFVEKSTQCELLNGPKEFAREWSEDRVIECRTYRDFGEQSFRAYSEKLQTTQKREIARGELSAEMRYNEKLKLDNDLIPYLGHVHITKIDYNLVVTPLRICTRKRSIPVIAQEVCRVGAQGPERGGEGGYA